MKVSVQGVRVDRGDWSLSAEGTFNEGIHLVSGDVGSGKSTLALMLAGLLTAASGYIERQGISSHMIAFQFPEFHITGTDIFKECRSWGIDPGPVLASAGLADGALTDPHALSRGELKRLVLFCILAKQYDLLILDEPFSSLDCVEKERLCAELSGRKHGITVIFTHEQAFFPKVDRIWEISGGILHDRGRVPDALGRWEHAPAVIRDLVRAGKVPANISRTELLEAVCRT
ncbi:ATP-binding cassette domain-containing protein [Methanoregula sp. PtaB.Bin085]|uniref:ATP-binding cassette domain-containing protein n=1 Tax=Methanoregula sp. PtaB.Bin085 TaxID=1811680 RepID=UPI0009D2FFAE|nr:ATP-binding cassette domain-containing protein [Methanoregula sp. PtaB.Bin085]OPX65464.1 MAG: Trehalose/maltose import ATP-binding protein MalK [Methanoregula sp. PtaB.Bin085]